MGLLKKIVKAFFAISMGCAIAVVGYYSIIASLEVSSIETIQDLDNVSRDVRSIEQQTIKKSRKTAVRVFSMSDKGTIATSSGTYFTVKGKYYVLTVMHGLLGGCLETRAWTATDGFFNCREVVTVDITNDYAIIEIEEIPSLSALHILRDLPTGSAWKRSLAAQTTIYYTGFPNNVVEPLTFSGKIVGYAGGDYIYLDSFAWSGSSGSGVFTADGKFIGYILAVEVGQTDYGPDVLENLIVVIPAFKIDWSLVIN